MYYETLYVSGFQDKNTYQLKTHLYARTLKPYIAPPQLRDGLSSCQALFKKKGTPSSQKKSKGNGNREERSFIVECKVASSRHLHPLSLPSPPSQALRHKFWTASPKGTTRPHQFRRGIHQARPAVRTAPIAPRPPTPTPRGRDGACRSLHPPCILFGPGALLCCAFRCYDAQKKEKMAVGLVHARTVRPRCAPGRHSGDRVYRARNS